MTVTTVRQQFLLVYLLALLEPNGLRGRQKTPFVSFPRRMKIACANEIELPFQPHDRLRRGFLLIFRLADGAVAFL